VGGGRAQRENREREGLEVDDVDEPAIFQKCRDSTVKPKQLSNHSSNENVPKRKSVEVNKIYMFALRFSFKRVKDLNLFLKLGKILNFREILFKIYTPIESLG
jgi:hypothetical protein